MKTSSRIARACGAFSLMEMMMVLLVLSLMGTFFLASRMVFNYDERAEITRQRLQTIQHALVQFRQINKRIPCPGNLTLTSTSSDLGAEASNPGSCIGGAVVANFSNGNYAGGSVPTRTLGLDDTYLIDGFGRRFTYVVDKRVTDTCAATSININDSAARLTINDGAGNTRTTRAWYAIVSHGENGHGAYLNSGARYSASSTNVLEQENCDCSADATIGTLDNTLIQSAAIDSTTLTNYFDDITVYGLREHLRSREEEYGQSESCT